MLASDEIVENLPDDGTMRREVAGMVSASPIHLAEPKTYSSLKHYSDL
jgi:hypothetical protein